MYAGAYGNKSWLENEDEDVLRTWYRCTVGKVHVYVACWKQAEFLNIYRCVNVTKNGQKLRELNTLAGKRGYSFTDSR